MDPDWRMTSENGSYLYPDLETGYNGVFRGGVMVAARAAIIVADKVLESVLRVKVTKVWGPGREFREASEETLSTLPLLRDPYEERLTEVRVSEVPGGGEGLFAKVDIEPGTLVAIYNGVKRGPYAEVSPESWDQCGYSIGYYESTTAERGEKEGRVRLLMTFDTEMFRLGGHGHSCQVSEHLQLLGHDCTQDEPQLLVQLRVL